MKETQNFSKQSKELIDKLELFVSSNGVYVNIDYGTTRFRVSKDTDVRVIKKMMGIHNYSENDICIMCAFIINELCLSVYFEPVIKLSSGLSIVGGSVLQSDKAGDFNIDMSERTFLNGETGLDEYNDIDYTDDSEEEYRFYLEQLSKYIKLAVEDKYKFLMELVSLIIDYGTV